MKNTIKKIQQRTKRGLVNTIGSSKYLSNLFLLILELYFRNVIGKNFNVNQAFVRYSRIKNQKTAFYSMVRFLAECNRIRDIENILKALYPAKKIQDSFYLCYKSYAEGIILERKIAKIWHRKETPSPNDEKLMLEYLNQHPNYAFSIVGGWDTMPKEHMTRKKRIKKLMGNHKGRILDIACSCNPFMDMYSNHSFVGVDLSLPSLQISRIRNQSNKHHLINADAQNLPFKNNIFDIIVASEIMEHLPNPEKMIIEISRVLKKGGISIISVPIHCVKSKIKHNPGDSTHRGSFFSYKKLISVFKRNSLEPDRVLKDPYYIFRLRKSD